MNVTERIDALDVTLFNEVPSQTSQRERAALLAIQSFVRGNATTYSYLEVGSYLGGSLQPYVVDPKCVKIYSIDPRPSIVNDQRREGCTVEYVDNSAAHMLQLLDKIEAACVAKVQCFDSDAAKLRKDSIEIAPIAAFIDGEHTRSAVLSDFEFCRSVVAEDAIIAFHDTQVVLDGIISIIRSLKKRKIAFRFSKLHDSVSMIAFGAFAKAGNSALHRIIKENQVSWCIYLLKERVKGVLPAVFVSSIQRLKRKFRW